MATPPISAGTAARMWAAMAARTSLWGVLPTHSSADGKWRRHAAFDPLWKRGPFRGRRRAAYAWLAEKMALPVEKTHIGMFDERQRQQVIEIIRQGGFENAKQL